MQSKAWLSNVFFYELRKKLRYYHMYMVTSTHSVAEVSDSNLGTHRIICLELFFLVPVQVCNVNSKIRGNALSPKKAQLITKLVQLNGLMSISTCYRPLNEGRQICQEYSLKPPYDIYKPSLKRITHSD